MFALAARGAAAEARELCLADTIGAGVPSQVRDLADRAGDRGSRSRRYGHFHNTRNTGFANAVAAVEAKGQGARTPAPGASAAARSPARPATSPPTTVFLLERMGLDTGYDLVALLPTAFLGDQLGHEVPALVPRAGSFRPPERNLSCCGREEQG